jgi:ABC-type transport system involved in cytochrome c biogenesis permease subunit
METTLINTGLALYIAASAIGIFYLLQRDSKFFRICTITATGGFASLTLGIALRWFAAGRPPLSNIYETLVFFAWAAWLVPLVLLIPRGMRELAVLATLIPVVCLGYASTLDNSIRPLMPALKSNWLAIHVASNFLGYAGFAAGFIAGLGMAIRLMRRRSAKKWEKASVVCIRFGFIFLTYGILTGSVWANEAWGRYWGWDPKEIWALLTWIFYFFFFFARARGKKTGKTAQRLPLITVFFAVGGFCFVIFTYLGVSYMLKGLHSYL